MGVRSGHDLWDRRVWLFPSLIFCENVRREIQGLQVGDPLLKQVVKRLLEIQNYCRGWNVGPFNPADLPFKITGESEATMNQYSAERTFVVPDNNIALIFKLHGRLTPHTWRIYFEPVRPGSMYIGYIGPKLPTVEYPT